MRAEYEMSVPFPNVVAHEFLTPGFLDEVIESLPTYELACRVGRVFTGKRERNKVQLSDRSLFPGPVTDLLELLISDDFVQMLREVTGMPLIADPGFLGGGIHMTPAGGRLDVHVDFNYVPEKRLFRRLNLLLFLNRGWSESWGGQLELWDRGVRCCERTINPSANTCVFFETSDHSFHGVTEVTCPKDETRKSFAMYYYSESQPPDWNGRVHDTVFMDRPGEENQVD